MSKADILINLRGKPTYGGVMWFPPGVTLQGNVQVIANTNVNCRQLSVSLLWTTQGKGTRDMAAIGEQIIYRGMLSAGTPLYQEFAFPLPLYPWSYSGHYVSIVWQILVKLDVPWGSDPTGRAVFILHPNEPTVGF